MSETVNDVAVDTINTLVVNYLKKFKFYEVIPFATSGKRFLRNSRNQRVTEKLTTAAYVDDPTYDGINTALKRLLWAMEEVEGEAGAEFMEMIKWRKGMEEIFSIMHVGRSHPESAIVRLKKLKENPVKPERIIKSD